MAPYLFPRVRFPPRHVILFIGAVVMPCTALIVTGARMLSQDRELADKRDADDLRRAAASAGRVVLGRLDLLWSREAQALNASTRNDGRGYADSATVFAARIVRGRVDVPWIPAGGDPTSTRFEVLVAAGERRFVAHALPQAIAAFDSAARIAPDAQRRANAELSAARAAADGSAPDRLTRLRRLAQLPLRIRDEYGVPVALYAERRLKDAGGGLDVGFIRRAGKLISSRDLSPATCSLARTVLISAVAQDKELAARCAALEHAADVVDEWRPATTPDTSWMLDRSQTLLVSSSGTSLIIARLDRVLSTLTPLAFPVRIETGARGEALSPALAGLRAVPLGAATVSLTRWKTTRDFYVAALGLILVTGFCVSFLLWRDTQREMRLATLRSQFVSGVSHELKTPLTAIRMYAETLRAGRPRNPAARDEYLDTIVAESERLSRLLDNVLDFAKIERGTKNYSLQPRHLADIVEDARRIMAHAVGQRGFEVVVEVERDLPTVLVDADAIEQALLNLIVNAMKYSGDSRRITLRVARENHWAVITVVDAGIGIAHAERARIFEQFYRAPGPQNSSVPGAGLGLTIVQHIAAAHRGKVTVASEEGRGSAFSIHLPLHGATAAERPAPVAPTAGAEVAQ